MKTGKPIMLLALLLMALTIMGFAQQAVAEAANDVSLVLSTYEKTINKGKTVSIKGLVTPKKATGKFIKYSSSDTSIARVTQAGKIKGVGYGDAVITAAYGDDVASCFVTVTGPIVSIKLNETKATIETGDKLELYIDSYSPFNAEIDMTSAKWSSSKASVAQVSGGVVTALKPGKAKLTCKLGGKSASCTVTVTPKAMAAVSDAVGADTIQGSILELVNKERQVRGLKVLSYSKSLETAANLRAAELLQLFDHTRPNGKSFYTAIAYDIDWAGENIAKGFDSAQAVMKAWMESPGHMKNILKTNYTELGVGTTEQNGTVFYVQLFSSGRK